jgi:hypothetical protein
MKTVFRARLRVADLTAADQQMTPSDIAARLMIELRISQVAASLFGKTHPLS